MLDEPTAGVFEEAEALCERVAFIRAGRIVDEGTPEESFDGLVARLFRRSLRKTLDATLESGLRHLKIEAERRTQL